MHKQLVAAIMLAALALSASADAGPRRFPGSVYHPEGPLLVGGTFAPTSGTAYCVFIGRPHRNETINTVRFHVTTAGAGAQTAEVGIYTSPLPPNRTGQTLTRVAATGALDVLTSTGLKANTTPLAANVEADVPLWACIRTAMATTQPTIVGLARDQQDGFYMTTAASGALTSAATLAGVVPALSTATQAPYMRAYP